LREHSGDSLRHVLGEKAQRQPSNSWNAIVMEEPFENLAAILEIQVCRNRSESADADDGIRILQGSVEKTRLGYCAADGEQLVHLRPDRWVELPATSKRVLASIGQQDRLERTLNSAVVAPMLSQHANNEWERVQNEVPIVRPQTTDQKFTSASSDGFDP